MNAPRSAPKSARTPRPNSPTTADQHALAAPAGRHQGADALKAAAIVGVVFIHANGLYVVPLWFHQWVTGMFRFGVPVFVALYVHFASQAIDRRDDARAYLRSRFGRLLLQYVFWSVVYAALTAQWTGLTPLKFVTRHWSGNGWAGQYYFIVVLQLTVLMPWLIASGRWFMAHRAWLIAGSMVFFIGLVYPAWPGHPLVPQLNDRPVLYWLPYAWLGVAWFGHVTARGRTALLLLAATVLLMPLETRWLAPPNVVDSPYVMPTVFIATVALLTLGGANAFAEPGRWFGWLQRPVSVLANNTLGVFVLNPLVILGLRQAFAALPSGTGPTAAVLVPLTATAVVLAVSLALTMALKRSAVCRRLVA